MRTVFIVTSGDYSDYSINSVWTTRAEAELEAGKYGRVEEWVLNERRPVTDHVQWRAWTRSDTGAIVVADKADESQEIHYTSVEKRNGKWIGWGYGVSAEHARKSLSDALAKAKAEEAGL